MGTDGGARAQTRGHEGREMRAQGQRRQREGRDGSARAKKGARGHRRECAQTGVREQTQGH